MIYDVIIIGAGPAGLGAAIYGARAGMKLAVIDKSPISGGQVLTTYEVDNYLGFPGISGSDLGTKFREHADSLKVPFIEEDVQDISIDQATGLKKILTDQNQYEAKAIIIATGAHHAKLKVPGEEELMGMGVSYCATCDGAFFRNRTVAVVGGGDVAVEDAIFLAGICKNVYVIHRRNELRAAKSLQDKLQSFDNVTMCWNKIVTEVQGEDQVENIKLKDTVNGETENLPVDGVFVAVGINPETEIFKNLFDMDEKGYAIAKEDCQTSTPGIFVAGDIRKKALRQIITAVADGANAITGVQNYFTSLM